MQMPATLTGAYPHESVCMPPSNTQLGAAKLQSASFGTVYVNDRWMLLTTEK